MNISDFVPGAYIHSTPRWWIRELHLTSNFSSPLSALTPSPESLSSLSSSSPSPSPSNSTSPSLFYLLDPSSLSFQTNPGSQENPSALAQPPPSAALHLGLTSTPSNIIPSPPAQSTNTQNLRVQNHPIANPAPQMPLHGTQNALKFDGKTLALLLHFLEDVDILGTVAGITDLEKICAAIRYADLEEAEGWELLDEVTANPPDWVNFSQAVKKLYPCCKGANRYCQADIQYLVQEFQAKPMCTLEDLGEYQCKFLKIIQILIHGRKVLDLDWDALFLSSLPADLETQVCQCLLITKSTQHSSDPYPITDINEATQFLLTSSALCSLIAAPAAGMPSAQPYYPAWAALVPTPVVPQTITPTAASAVKQEQINLQSTAHQDCAFYADPSHFMGSCPFVEGYIQARKANWGTDSCLYLPDGQRIPCIQGTALFLSCHFWHILGHQLNYWHNFRHQVTQGLIYGKVYPCLHQHQYRVYPQCC